MDVYGVMNTYNMYSIWNNINPQNASTSSTVPLVSNINSSVQDNYAQMNYFGQSTDNELQDIYEKVEPNFGTTFTYDKNGNFSAPSDGSMINNSDISLLLNSNNLSADNLAQNVLSQYNSIENGLNYSILSNRQYDLYNTIYSLGSYQAQNSNNFIDTTV